MFRAAYFALEMMHHYFRDLVVMQCFLNPMLHILPELREIVT